MGLFSSKTVTTVGTSVSRVIEDKDIPNSVKTGAFRSMINNDGQMVENSMEELSQSIGNKANRMYEYGKNTYEYGLPNSTLHSQFSGKELVERAIEEDFGPVTLDYYHFGALNTLHVGWLRLCELYGYNSITNKMTVNGKEVFLYDMVVVVQEATVAELANGALDQWGTPPNAGATPDRIAFPTLSKPTPWETSPTTVGDYVRVTYGWLNDAQIVTKAELVISIIGLNETGSWHQAKYIKADGTTGFFLYEAGEGEYPAIDKINTPAWETGGSFFPWMYFRLNKQDITATNSPIVYKQSKKLGKYLGVDWETVADAINENPDIKDVENAFLIMAVPAVTKNQMEMRYLFDYFDGLYQVTGGSLGPSNMADGLQGLFNHLADSGSEDQSIIIQDKRFKMALGFRRIYKAKIAGNIGKIGTYSTGHGKENIDEGPLNNSNIGTVTFHFYRKQLSETVYEEVRVINMRVKYYVFEDYTAIANEDDDILLIPLDRSITKSYSLPKREELYARSMHYVFNSRVLTKLKWYQQGWFRGVMFIVAVVITVYSFGQAYQSIVAALATGATTQAVLIWAVTQLLTQVLIAYGIKLFVKIVGLKIAFIVAIVAALYGGYQAFEAGSIKGAPYAQEMLDLSTGLTKAVSGELKEEMRALADDYSDFENYTKTQEEKLEAAQNLLSYNNYLMPAFIYGETPVEYYDRTVHSGNIGVLALDMISSYVDVALTLPKLSDSLQE